MRGAEAESKGSTRIYQQCCGTWEPPQRTLGLPNHQMRPTPSLQWAAQVISAGWGAHEWPLRSREALKSISHVHPSVGKRQLVTQHSPSPGKSRGITLLRSIPSSSGRSTANSASCPQILQLSSGSCSTSIRSSTELGRAGWQCRCSRQAQESRGWTQPSRGNSGGDSSIVLIHSVGTLRSY